MLEDVKALLGLEGNELDDRLETIEKLVKARLCARLKQSDVPEELDYIITEAVIRRFNRIGSEGLSAHSVEGESQSYESDDFAPFEDDIQRWIKENGQGQSGRIRFL